MPATARPPKLFIDVPVTMSVPPLKASDPAEPARFERSETLSDPEPRTVPPVNVLLPASTSRPMPLAVSPPEPLIAPKSVNSPPLPTLAEVATARASALMVFVPAARSSAARWYCEGQRAGSTDGRADGAKECQAAHRVAGIEHGIARGSRGAEGGGHPQAVGNRAAAGAAGERPIGRILPGVVCAAGPNKRIGLSSVLRDAHHARDAARGLQGDIVISAAKPCLAQRAAEGRLETGDQTIVAPPEVMLAEAPPPSESWRGCWTLTLL